MSTLPGFDITQAADDDLFDIYIHTDATFGEHQAGIYIADLKQAFADLSEHPKLGRQRDELRKGLRSLPKNRHVIFYRIAKRRVRIVRVLAMTQDVGRAFK